MNLGAWLVSVFVFVLNVCGWVFLFGMDLMACDPLVCSREVIVMVLVQSAETVFLAFQCLTCDKAVWSAINWLMWAVALFVVVLAGLLESWIFWQDHIAETHEQHNAVFELTLGVRLDFAPQTLHSMAIVGWFVFLSCWMPLFLMFYLVFRCVQQSHNCFQALSEATHNWRTLDRI